MCNLLFLITLFFFFPKAENYLNREFMLLFTSSVLEEAHAAEHSEKGAACRSSPAGQMLLPIPCQDSNSASVSRMEQLNPACETEARACPAAVQICI